MELHRKALVALAAAAGIVAGTLVAAGPATAARSDCFNYSDVVCLAEHGNWTGQIWRQRSYQINGCRPLEGFNDKASAWLNQTSYTVVLWEHHDCRGGYRRLPPGHWEENGGQGYDNYFSAVMVTPL